MGAKSVNEGKEPWRCDTSGTCELVMDINAGTGSSHPSGFTEFNSEVWFTASGAGGKEPFYCDASNNCDYIELQPGTTGSLPTDFAVFNSKIYFQAFDPTSFRELYACDGQYQCGLVRDFAPQTNGNSVPAGLVVLNNHLYFEAKAQTTGEEIHKCDTSETCTAVEIVAGATGTAIADITVFNNKLYFSAIVSPYQRELWSCDTSDVCALVQDIEPAAGTPSNPKNMAVFNNRLYFQAVTNAYQTELWSCGTDDTCSIVADLVQGGNGVSPEYLAPAPSGDKLWFVGGGDDDHVWTCKTNHECARFTDPSAMPTPYAGYLTWFDGKLYLTAFTAANGFELYRIG